MLTKEARLSILTAAIGVGGALNGGKVALITDANELEEGDVLTDHTQAAYTGYALSSTVVFGTPFDNSAGNAETLGGLKAFQPSDDVAPAVITGALLLNGAGDTIIGGQLFDQPVPLPDENAALSVVPKVVVGRDGIDLSFVVVS